jgi:hypothetical protein
MATKTAALVVMSMAAISKLTQAETVNLFAEKTATVSRAFMDCAKLVVHLRTTLSKSQTVYGVLGKKGVHTSTINNALVAVKVWDALVVPKLLTEGQFETISHHAFQSILKAVKVTDDARSIAALVIVQDRDEIEFIADNGITSASKKAADDKAARDAKPASAKEPAKEPAKRETAPPVQKTPDDKEVTTLTEPPKEEVTTLHVAPVQEAPKVVEEAPKNVVQMPSQNDGGYGFKDAIRMIDEIESIALTLNPDELLGLCAKLVALTDGVQGLTIQAKQA